MQNNRLTVFIYSDISVVYEATYDAPGDPLAALDLDLSTRTSTSTVDYIRGNGQLVAKVTPGTDPTGYLPGEVATYFHLDHLGSTRAQTDQAGNVVARMDYEPFGEYLSGTQGSEAYTYTGQRDDGGTGLYYYGARFYDPALGRFITQDPAQDGLNWYVYVGNSPMRYVDPTGMYDTMAAFFDEDKMMQHNYRTTENSPIAIDAGHGGPEGSRAAGLFKGETEAGFNLDIALKLKEYLDGLGFNTTMVGNNTDGIVLNWTDRGPLANKRGASIFVSIHLDATKTTPEAGSGLRVLYPSSHDVAQSLALANSIYDSFGFLGYPERDPWKRSNLAVLNSTEMPAAVIEAGFLRAQLDYQYIRPSTRAAFAYQFARGIAHYMNGW